MPTTAPYHSIISCSREVFRLKWCKTGRTMVLSSDTCDIYFSSHVVEMVSRNIGGAYAKATPTVASQSSDTLQRDCGSDQCLRFRLPRYPLRAKRGEESV